MVLVASRVLQLATFIDGLYTNVPIQKRGQITLYMFIAMKDQKVSGKCFKARGGKEKLQMMIVYHF